MHQSGAQRNRRDMTWISRRRQGYLNCSDVFGCRPQPILRKIEHLPSRFSLNIAPGFRGPFKCRDRCPWRAQGFPRRLSASGHIFHRKNYLILPGNLFLLKPMKTKSPKIVAELSPFLFSTPRSPFSSGSHHYIRVKKGKEHHYIRVKKGKEHSQRFFPQQIKILRPHQWLQIQY